jgi:hypothetical protein
MAMMRSDDVTLQINLTAADLRHARQTVPHQIRQLADQVAHVVLNIDEGAAESKDGSGQGRPDEREALERWLSQMRAEHAHLSTQPVDYSPEATRRVADTLYAGQVPPRVDFRGRPIYSYLEPLVSAPTDWVLHLDSDMLLGGGGSNWVADAQESLRRGDGYILASPYPGPPRDDGRVSRQPGVEYVEGPNAISVPNMSSRVFLMHRPTFVRRLAPLPLLRAPWKGRLWTLRQPNPPFEKLELAVTARMNELGLRRLDRLGTPPGMWSLHPPYRSETFYSQLPELIARVEAGDVPLAQRGDFDVNDSMIDWSDARRAMRRARTRAMVLGRRA